MAARVAIIGRGSIGQRHAAVFADLLGTKSVATFPAGLRDGLSVAAVLDDVLAMAPTHAVIAAPAHLHLPFAQPLLAQRLNCLVEKPLCLTASEAAAWCESQAEGWLPWVGYNLHYRPEYRFIRQHLARLGALSWAEFRCGQALDQWRPGRDPATTVTLSKAWGGGVLRELSHELEMAISLLGPLSVASASAQRGYYGSAVEEAVQATLATESGCSVSLSIDLYRALPERRILLVGEQGQMEVDFIARCASLVFSGGVEQVEFDAVDTYRCQAEHFVLGREVEWAPRVSDAVMTMQLIGELERTVTVGVSTE